MRLSLTEIAGCVRAQLTGGPAELVTGTFHTDSRQVQPGGLFFALEGQAMDGHVFAADAVARGAAAIVVQRRQELGVAQVLVDDTWEALYRLAAFVLNRVKPLVIGITGSNGKTSTKELTAAVLSARYRVHSTPGNLNSETGVPLTVLNLEPEHSALVLELGMQREGDIARLARLARPSVGVITGIGSVHAEFFPEGRDGIARAKGELLEHLPAQGLGVLNADDPYLQKLAQRCPAPIVTFGLEGGDLRAHSYCPLPEGGSTFTAAGPDRKQTEVRLRLSGRHQLRNALAALAVARFAGVPLEEGAGLLADVRVAHRMEETIRPEGWILIDDAYNASPESMLASLETVADRYASRRRLALLGEMRELGSLAEEAHRQVGTQASELFDRVAVIEGGWAGVMARAARADLLPDLEAGEKWVRRQARSDDVVLIKASFGAGLWKIVRDLKPEGARY